MFTFAREGTNFVLEFSAEDELGQAINSGLTITASIRKDVLYWDDTPDTFSSVSEVQLTLAFALNGLYRFTSVGGAELTTQKYEIHLTVTGHEAVNKNSTFTETIHGGLAAYPDGFINYDGDGAATGTIFEKDGTFNNKSSVANDAVTLANLLGSKQITIRDFFTPSSSMIDFFVKGLNTSQDFFTFNNINAENITVEDCAVIITDMSSGDASGSIFRRCLFSGTHDWDDSDGMSVIDSVMDGTTKINGTTFSVTNCTSNQQNALNIQALAAGSKFFVKKFVGNLAIISETFANTHYIHMMGGKVTFDSSNTSGTVILTGWGEKIDTSGVGFVVNLDGWQDLPVASLGADLVSIKGTALSETTAGRLAANFGLFYDNNDATTTKVVDDVGGGGGGGGGVDLVFIMGTSLTEGGAGQLANAFTNLLDVATPSKTINDIGNITQIEGSATVDTLTLTTMFENMIARQQGDVARSVNTYSYKKQNGTTTAFAYTTSGTGRT
jgi:hypothetical protein